MATHTVALGVVGEVNKKKTMVRQPKREVCLLSRGSV